MASPINNKKVPGYFLKTQEGRMEASDNLIKNWIRFEGICWFLLSTPSIHQVSTIKTSYGSAYHNMSSSNIYMMERLLYPTMTSSTIFNNNSVKIL